MREMVEVHSNPRSDGLTASDVRIVAALKAEMKPRRRKSKGKKKDKPKKRRKRKYKPYLEQVVMGAAAAMGVEMLVVRNPEYYDKLPKQLRRYSGLAMAGAGYMVIMNKKAKAKTKAMAVGVVATGLAITLQEEVYKARADKLVTMKQKIIDDMAAAGAVAGTAGLGDHGYPKAPYMSEEQAAAALGMQPRMPYQPHGAGMGDLVHLEGMGELLMVPQGPVDLANNPQLTGLGDLVQNESDTWLSGQFAYAGDDWRSNGWG